MTAEPGRQLLHYRLIEKIGEGGMGVVWKAEDTKLQRHVALKVLPQSVATDPDRRARFEREARAVAALNHPNIVTLYSVEEADGVHFITMELVEGQNLAQLLPSGGFPLARLLEIAIPLADAVSRAHRAGITHRDLKPDNIMIDAEGRLRVLDFGLAKLQEPSDSAAHLPTATRVTGEGKIVGTVAYMSPEQAEGKPVDHRSDVFSLGTILYELSTGKRPFQGDTSMSTIGAILKEDPSSVTEVNPALPRHAGRILRRCLAKDPDRRYQTAIDLRNDLEGLAEEVHSGELEAVGAVGGRAPAARRSWIPAALVAFAILAVGYGLSSRFLDRPDGGLARPFDAMKITPLTTDGRSEEPAISADGRYVAYVRHEPDGRGLWLRQVSLPSAVRIVPPHGGSLYDPIFSPEGDYVYYVRGAPDTDEQALYRVPVLGGSSSVVLEEVDERISFSPDGERFVFLRWVPPNRTRLLIADRDGDNVQVIAERKEPEAFANEPVWSPDGRVMAVPVVRWTGQQETRLVTVPAEGGAERPISERTWADIGEIAWLPDGSGLVFGAREAWADSFQLWQISYPGGDVHRVTNDLNNYEGVGLTADGRTLVTEIWEPSYQLWTVSSADMDSAAPVAVNSGDLKPDSLAWTPDGKIVYGAIAQNNIDLWITDPSDGGSSRLTHEDGYDGGPSVCADGRYILFESMRSGSLNIWRMDPDGGNKVRLTSGEADGTPRCHPDGRRVLYTALGENQLEIAAVSIDGGEPKTIIPEERNIAWFALDISPDGESLAFLSWDAAANRRRLEVASLADPGNPRTFDIAGSFGASDWASVRWSPDGGSIHFVREKGQVGNLWSQPLDGGPPQQVTRFPTDRMAHFAWSFDGSRLAVARGERSHDVVLLENFR